MRKIYRHIFFSFLILLLNQKGNSQEDKTTAPAPKRLFGFRSLKDTVEKEKNGVFVLPLIYYTPDTRWAFGAAGVCYFKVIAKDTSEKDTRVSNTQFLVDYTQNKQFDVWGQWNVFTHNENYLFKGEVRYRNFPDRFYGIGNRTLKENEERYVYNLISFKTLALKKLAPAVFAGVDYHFEKEYNFTYAPDGALQTGTITGYNGGIQSAIGLVGIYDSRDNIINTYKGILLEVSSYFYKKQLGSTFDFTYLNLLYHQFWQLKKKHILGLQVKGRYGYGNIPFLDMSAVGNDDLLRGYPKNRYRDRSSIGTQIEYRFPLFWRLGMVVFGGAGDVFSKISDLSLDHLKYSYGTGLRFAVNPAERLNIRLDYSHGKEGGYFYFVVAESF